MKSGYIHEPPRTNINEGNEWAAYRVILLSAIDNNKWWGKLVDFSPKTPPILVEKSCWYEDEEESTAPMVDIDTCRAQYRRFLLEPARAQPTPMYLRAFHTFACRTKNSEHWTDYVFSQPLEPPLIPPLPVPQQPANNAHALARLRHCMMERNETEAQWVRRVQSTVQRHRAVLDRSRYGSAPIDISSFDMSAPLHALHPSRKMLQLLQQHMRLSPTL